MVKLVLFFDRFPATKLIVLRVTVISAGCLSTTTLFAARLNVNCPAKKLIALRSSLGLLSSLLWSLPLWWSLLLPSARPSLFPTRCYYSRLRTATSTVHLTRVHLPRCCHCRAQWYARRGRSRTDCSRQASLLLRRVHLRWSRSRWGWLVST